MDGLENPNGGERGGGRTKEWPLERTELLKKLYGEGLSASQIAGKLGGITRNAVIGKIHRLGLSGRANKAEKARGNNVLLFRKRNGLRGALVLKKSVAIRPLDGPLNPNVVPDRPLKTLEELAEDECHYYFGDPKKPGTGYCGLKVRGRGSKYCQDCYEASRIPGSTLEKLQPKIV